MSNLSSLLDRVRDMKVNASTGSRAGHPYWHGRLEALQEVEDWINQYLADEALISQSEKP